MVSWEHVPSADVEALLEVRMPRGGVQQPSPIAGFVPGPTNGAPAQTFQPMLCVHSKLPWQCLKPDGSSLSSSEA